MALEQPPPERPQFGTVGFYRAMADALNFDAIWLEKGREFTCSMVYAYGPPVDTAFFVHFEAGAITEVDELGTAEERPADLVVSGPCDAWKAILQGTLKPAAAMATGKLKVRGRKTLLLKNMASFTRIIDVMTQLDPVYD